MKILSYSLALIAIFLAISLVLSLYMTRRAKLTEIHSPAEFGMEYEEVTFAASDGLQLHGWWIPTPDSNRAVIILHGHGGSMDWDVWRAPPFHAAGFNVLLFDFRAHGRSQGKAITFGYLERRDVVGAVEFLRSRGMRRIGLLGFSLGGIAAMLATPFSPHVSALISDGGPARILTALTVWGVERHMPHFLAAALAGMAITGASLRMRANLFRCAPLYWVSRISPRPILFIHGEQDQYVPDFDDLYAAALPPKEVWRLPEAGHTTVGQLYPEEHQRRILAFFQQHL